ncbi:ROK family transcriptional regulator [Thiospirochaeta perfilievii]|uniref:ROK family transcriptional regulator n=1 Tax=Thiospirochaeta perfilievii TaxID=252967 RepID=A0A5C1QEP5_9SPIO|nr:ROK family transcriptional regulator [Thiospirochaeta perfilievii]QEN05116.1 ROK family transcriptional regulator [Thiospirochaeta perfilievii]
MHPSIKNSINKTRVLQEIRKEKGISRIEISKILGLDKSTISKITSDLLEEGLIIDKKTEEELNHAGRRRIGLSLNNNYGVILGLEIQTEYFNAVIINLHGDILLNYREELPEGDLLTSIDKLLEKVIKKTEDEFDKLLGIGIGIPGLIDPYKGIIIQSKPLNINTSLELYSYLNKKYTYPIFIDNDANCCCWGELTFSLGKRDNNFLVVLGEKRPININDKQQRSIVVGIGIVIDGKVLIGDNFSAGEFRSIYWNNSNNTQFSITDDEAENAIDNMDITLKVIKELQKQIALFVNTFNITKVIYTGFFTDYKLDTKRILENEIENNWGYDLQKNTNINFSTFGDYDVSYGAAGLIVEKLFTTPDISFNGDRNSLKGIDLFNYISNS